jgi:hypothetical protein
MTMFYRWILVVTLVIAETSNAWGARPKAQLPTGFVPEAQDAQTPVVGLLQIIQQDPVMTPDPLSNLANGSGVVGMALFGTNQGKKKEADRRVQPLLGKGLGEQMNKLIVSSFTEAIATSSWMKTLRVDITNENKTVDTANNSVVRMGISYDLTVKASSICITVGIGYFRQGGKTAVLGRMWRYYSPRLNLDPVPVEAAITRWAADDALLYRTTMDEAVREMTALLREQFFSPPASSAAAGHLEKIEWWDPLSDSKVKWPVIILHEDADRMVFQASFGPVYSVPKQDVKVMK